MLELRVEESIEEKMPGKSDADVGQSKSYSVDEIRQEYPNAYQPWTAEADEELQQLYGTASSITQLAVHFGRRPGAITSRLNRLGLDADKLQNVAITGGSKDYDDGLFEKLRMIRLRFAREQKVSPFVVFNNTTLRELATSKPTDQQAMLHISGVGPAKMERYGETFLAAIRDYLGGAGTKT